MTRSCTGSRSAGGAVTHSRPAGSPPTTTGAVQAAPPGGDPPAPVRPFASATGTLATVRATPFYWRVHVFGTKGSAEVLDEVTMILRKAGDAPRRMSCPAVDVLRAELDAFADAIEKRKPFPVPEAEVLATLSAFEAALQSMTSGMPVVCHGS